MKKYIAFCFVSLFAMIVFAQELPVDNQQSVMPTNDQPAVPEMTLPECKEKLENCSGVIVGLQTKLDECRKKMAEKKRANKKQAAANVAVGTADQISQQADKLPDGPEKTAIKEAAEKVIQSNNPDDTIDRFDELEGEIGKLDVTVTALKAEVKEIKEGQVAQDTKLTDHGQRLDEIEKGTITGYVGGGFRSSSKYDTAGYGEVGAKIKVGHLKGPFKIDINASVYGSEIANLMGVEGHGLITWVSEDFEFIELGVGGTGGAMLDIKNGGKNANVYGGGKGQISFVYKRYRFNIYFTLGAETVREITGKNVANIFYQFGVGPSFDFGGPFESAKK